MQTVLFEAFRVSVVHFSRKVKTTMVGALFEVLPVETAILISLEKISVLGTEVNKPVCLALTVVFVIIFSDLMKNHKLVNLKPVTVVRKVTEVLVTTKTQRAQITLMLN